ncbi:TonB-dependent receptor [Pedobacter nyackensis]|uniref:SusC/RagA family TonB-linked outer membrane protein n=1 Tax=Pedobacter nyackensis TaxID=475255 RepID=UPI00293144C5|nr:TonB-dependent receptor [Pedobacter nyackensis]
MKRVLLLSSVILLFSLYSFSQNKKTIRGTVKSNEKELLEGVSVGVVGQSRSTQTDRRGEFSIEVLNPATARIRFSFVGYQTLEVAVKDSTNINIILQNDDKNTMEEIAIVAFGTQKKTSLTGAVTSVSIKDLKGPTSNLTTTLAGRVPGIIAFQRSGEPGQDNANFFVRGVGTFGAGKQDPLIYIDGIESSPTDLARMQPDNIDNFSVLKDAAATALYGSRGANGVLLLTTKHGSEGKTRINFRGENRISGNTKSYKLADNITYMKLANEAILTRDPLGQTPYDPNKIDNTAAGIDPILFPNNNWVDLLIKDYTNNYAANIDVSGGNEKSNFYVSLTYDENNGLLKTSDFNNFNSNVKARTYSLLSNINIKLTSTTKALISVRGIFDSNNSPVGGGSRIFTLASSSNPVAFPAVYPQRFLPYVQHPLFGSALLPNSTNILYTNPFAQSVSGFQQYNRSQLIPQITINQDLAGITPGLSARVMGFTQRDNDFTLIRRYSPFYYQARTLDGQTTLIQLNQATPGQPLIGAEPTEYLTYEPGAKNVSQVIYGEGVINYNRTFQDKHTIGGRVITTVRSSLTGNASTLQLSLPKRNLNFLGQVNYGFKDKYIVDFAFGYNGSERFANGKRYGFFPAVSAAWILTKEKFLENSKVLTNLKLRGSYGIIGNDQIGSDADRFFYLSEVNLNAGNGYTFGENYNYLRPGIQINRFANPQISWERSEQTNIGLEATLFNDFNIVVEAYKQNRTSVLLERTNIPSLVALQTVNPVNSALVYPRANIGKAESQGIDFSFNYSKNFSQNYWMKLNANFTYAASKLIFNEEPKYDASLAHLSKRNQSVNQLYGLVAERLFTDDVEVRNSPKQNFGEYRAGDIKYRDINGDGKISTLDVVPIGLPSAPEIIYGFGGSFGLKQFDFSFFFQGSARSSFFIDPSSRRDNNGNVIGISPFATVGGSQSGLLDVIAKDHWSEDNRNAYAFWPRLSSEVINNNAQTSTWWLRRGDFLRLKQVELGYNISNNLAKRIGLSSARLYTSALNLFSLSSFKTWEVEMAGNGLGYPLQRVYNLGLKLGI